MATDYYAILNITPEADDAAIRTSYLRLAKLTHPDKNGKGPDTISKFQLVSAAYETLKDASKRAAYDREYKGSRRAWPGGANSTSFGSSQRATANSSTGSTQPKASGSEQASPWKQKIYRLDQDLQAARKVYSTLLTTQGDIDLSLSQIRKAIEKLEKEAVEDDERERAASGWYAYFFMNTSSKQEMEGISRRRTERATGRIVIEAKRAALNARSDVLIKEIQKAGATVFELQSQFGDAKLNEARWRRQKQEDEQAERLRRQREELEKTRQQEQEQLRKMREQRRKAEEKKKREAQEKSSGTRWQEEKREHEQRTNIHNHGQDGKRDYTYPQTSTKARESTGAAGLSTCSHASWWDQVDGRLRCSNCQIVVTRFAFRCPMCSKIACASCRTQLKGRRK